MQIKHVKDRKKNLAFSVYLFFFYRSRRGLSEVINFNEQYESFTQRRLRGVLSGQAHPACPATGARLARAHNEGADQTAPMRGCLSHLTTSCFLACRLIFL